MENTIQAVADAPLKAGKLKRAISARLRHQARAAIYGFAPLRRLLERPPQEAAHWDHLFSETHFATYLAGTIEIELRNAIVSTLLRLHAPTMPRVLDVGCAGGSLAHALPAFDRYLGIDISHVAIEKANAFRSDAIDFQVASFDRFELSQPWDAVIFNEVLYYLSVDNAVSEVQRYMSALSRNGCMVISMKNDPKSHVIYRILKKQYNWKRAVLWQSKDDGPSYRVRINQERHAFLIACLTPL